MAGNSYGGYLTTLLFRSIPERLLGVGLLVPDTPRSDGTRDTPPAVTLRPDPSIFDDLAADEAWIPDALILHERRMVEEIRAHDMPGYRISDRAFLERLNEHYVLEGDAGRPGPPFAGPSLILAGRQDATVGYRGAWALVEELPRATYAVLDTVGHHLGRVEAPALFRASGRRLAGPDGPEPGCRSRTTLSVVRLRYSGRPGLKGRRSARNR